MADECMVKEEVLGLPCGREKFTTLDGTYAFGTGVQFKFSMPLCEQHYEAIYHRYVLDLGSPTPWGRADPATPLDIS